MVLTKRMLIAGLTLFFAVSGLFAGAKSDTSKTDGNKAGSLTIWSAMTQPERSKNLSLNNIGFVKRDKSTRKHILETDQQFPKPVYPGR